MTLPSTLHCVVSLSRWIITLHKIHRQLRRLSNYSKVKVATFWRMLFFGSLHIPTILKCCSESMLRRIHNKVLRRAVINYETTHIDEHWIKWPFQTTTIHKNNGLYWKHMPALWQNTASLRTEFLQCQAVVASATSTIVCGWCTCHRAAGMEMKWVVWLHRTTKASWSSLCDRLFSCYAWLSSSHYTNNSADSASCMMDFN